MVKGRLFPILAQLVKYVSSEILDLPTSQSSNYQGSMGKKLVLFISF
jgi:hypothetical protein